MRRRLVHYLEYVTTDQWRIPVGCVMFAYISIAVSITLTFLCSPRLWTEIHDSLKYSLENNCILQNNTRGILKQKAARHMRLYLNKSCRSIRHISYDFNLFQHAVPTHLYLVYVRVTTLASTIS